MVGKDGRPCQKVMPHIYNERWDRFCDTDPHFCSPQDINLNGPNSNFSQVGNSSRVVTPNLFKKFLMKICVEHQKLLYIFPRLSQKNSVLVDSWL
ncbi:unnamed protein product [Allacma fusca]|uniref:Uncharacterized protein n=1 Tax=Allacma fusca TaxID=39272 RepID=A0A8J2LHD7_9HEXA|nr:unnamed protein product [Allacma fusca]